MSITLTTDGRGHKRDRFGDAVGKKPPCGATLIFCARGRKKEGLSVQGTDSFGLPTHPEQWRAAWKTLPQADLIITNPHSATRPCAEA